jgi:hypothetical protein
LTPDRARARKYYIDRAMVRRTMKREQILEASAMSDYALRAVLTELLNAAVSRAADGRDVAQASDLRKCQEVWRELQLRGEQLKLI